VPLFWHFQQSQDGKAKFLASKRGAANGSSYDTSQGNLLAVEQVDFFNVTASEIFTGALR